MNEYNKEEDDDNWTESLDTIVSQAHTSRFIYAQLPVNSTNNLETKSSNIIKDDNQQSSSNSIDNIATSTMNPVISLGCLNDNKAGMENLNKERLNQVIEEMSKGSKFYNNMKRKEVILAERVTLQLAEKANLSSIQIRQGETQAELLLASLEAERDLTRVIVHVDMDAFFAAVEMREDHSLKVVPMAVGGDSMLSTSNYLARRFGVRAAMPGFIARRLCPELVIVPGRHHLYSEVGEVVRSVIVEYDPRFCSMGLDEAYLDFTDHILERKTSTELERNYPDIECTCGKRKLLTFELEEQNDDGESKDRPLPLNIDQLGDCTCSSIFATDIEGAVSEMRHRIHLSTRLTASAGIANNTMLAKICSDKNKPNGQYRIQPSREHIMKFVEDLQLKKVCGIGKVSQQMLSALGVVKAPDIFTQRGILCSLYSDQAFQHFLRIYLGISSNVIEKTFPAIKQPIDMYKKCHDLSIKLVEDLKLEKIKGQTVTLKLKNVSFETITRAKKLSRFTDNLDLIYMTARRLLQIELENNKQLEIRLMGVKLSQLCDGSKKETNTIVGCFKKIQEINDNKHIIKQENNNNDGIQVKLEISNTTENKYIIKQENNSIVGTQVKVEISNTATSTNITNQSCTPESLPTPPEPLSVELLPTLTCPVCNHLKPECQGNVELLSKHIDECLNHNIIREMLDEERRQYSSSSSKTKKRLSQNSPQNERKKKNSIRNFFT